MAANQEIINRLREVHAAVILEETEQFGQLTISIRKENVLAVVRFLQDDSFLSFDYLMDLFGVDYMEMAARERFAVIYNLYSSGHQHRMRLKAFIPEKQPAIDSVTHLWASANWAEREVFDMYGIIFNNHPDLQRILCPDDFKGFPLRKDFPLKGVGYRENYEKISRDTAQ